MNEKRAAVYSDVYDFENLYQAYKEVWRTKSLAAEKLDFERNLEANLLELQQHLIWRTYRPLPSVNFVVKEPKPRKISAPAVRDRIVQSALCRAIEPRLDARFIFDSYACRKEKGTLAAAKRASWFSQKGRNRFYLYCDVKKYFDSIDLARLERIFFERGCSDAGILDLVSVVLRHENESGFGLKIGSRFSQLAANVYLNELDFFAKNVLREKFYLRYMDDFLVFGESAAKLGETKAKIEAFLKNELALELNERTKIGKTKDGFEFVGYRFERGARILKNRAFEKEKAFARDWMRGKIGGKEFCEGMASRAGHAEGCADWKRQAKLLLKCLRHSVLEKSEIGV